VTLTARLVEKLRNAAAPIPYVPRHSPRAVFADSGQGLRTAELNAMGAVGTLFAIVNRTSTSVAKVDWHMHRLTNATGARVYGGQVCPMCDKPGVTMVDNHPALAVWNQPNRFYTRQEFVETEQQHVDLTGEGWWVIGRDQRDSRGFPTELWPVRPDRIEPVPHPTDFLAGYIYTSPDGEKVPLGLEDVIQIRMPNPADPYRGMGPVQSILYDLDSVRFSAEWNRNFFLNSAAPGGVVEVPNTLEDRAFDRLRDQWNENHRGVSRAHRVAILEGGAKWSQASYSMRDMQFVELRGVSREVIREAFGIHKHVLGLADDVNRANAEAASADFAGWLTVPRCDRFAGALNNDFLRLFGPMGKGYEFCYSNPVPEDVAAASAERESKANVFKTLIDAGVHPEDAATIAGLPPLRTVAPPPAPAAVAAPVDYARPFVARLPAGTGAYNAT
jgi:HK97 family phage portal protein